MTNDYTDINFVKKIAGITLDDALTDCLRYRTLKKLTNFQFLELLVDHFRSEASFDSLVDKCESRIGRGDERAI